MPLRVTIELIPHGDENRKSTQAVLNITNDGTVSPSSGEGNYRCGLYHRVMDDPSGGSSWMELSVVFEHRIPRIDYLDTAIRCLQQAQVLEAAQQASLKARAGFEPKEETEPKPCQ